MILLFAVSAFWNLRRKRKLNVLLEKKITERTRELELSRNELLRHLQEMNLRAERVSGFLKDSMNRIEGLCSTGLQDAPDTTTHSYLRRIHAIADEIRKGMHGFFGESTLESAPINIGI
jgi:hypothetical protein